MTHDMAEIRRVADAVEAHTGQTPLRLYVSLRVGAVYSDPGTEATRRAELASLADELGLPEPTDARLAYSDSCWKASSRAERGGDAVQMALNVETYIEPQDEATALRRRVAELESRNAELEQRAEGGDR